MLLAQLGPRVTGDRLPAARTPAGRGLVRAAIAAMTVALTDPDEPQRARVAQAAARALRDAVILDASATAEVVRGAIATPALQAWGVHGLRELIGVLPQITVQDPELAYDVAASVARLPADVGTRYPFGSQIMRLNVSSRDELASVRHQTSRIFAKVVSTDLRTATRMLVEIAEHEAEYFEAIPPGPGLRICSGGPLDRAGENLISTMTQALVAGLEREGRGAVRAAVAILVDDLVRAEAWELLLQAAATSDTAAAAQALTPALMTPPPFAEPLTWQPAQAVVERIAPHLGDTDRERIRAAIIAGTLFDTALSEAHQDTLLRRRHLLLETLDNHTRIYLRRNRTTSRRTGLQSRLSTTPMT